MLRRLISILQRQHPLQQATEMFSEMLDVCREMILEATGVYWERRALSAEERTALRAKDVRVNDLERKIRAAVVQAFSARTSRDVPYGLLLMSLVKDAERVGDYAKNLLEVPDMAGASGPEHRDERDGPTWSELREISRFVTQLAREIHPVFAAGDRERAHRLTVEGRSVANRCDKLVELAARSSLPTRQVVELTLATRFHKRINGHLLNILSSVLMPLHKLDFYDERHVLTD